MASWQKLSESVGSATPDPQKGEATAQPVPPPAVANKPPPGRKGPVGLQPRQTYSRVNTGIAPVPDAGTMTQKSQRPRGLEFLPAKVAQQEISMTTMMGRPSLQALVKEAMEGTASQVDINTEAMFQQANIGEPPPKEKVASVRDLPDVIPTDYVEKVAAALDYLSKQAEEGSTSLKPGVGPGALQVMEATSSEENYDVNDSGQAKTQIPTKPPMTSSGVAKDPPNAMQDNIDMAHPEQPVDPMGNEKTSAIYTRNLKRLGLNKEAAGTQVVTKLLGSGASPAAGTKVMGRLTRAGSALRELPGRVRSSVAEGARKAYSHVKAHPKAYGVGAGGTVAAGGGAALLAGGKKGKKKKASVQDELLIRNLLHLGIIKNAEDAINPANISAGPTQTGATPPEGASPSEEQVPNEPGDVNKQKAMVGSNQAAIDYTKGQAKSDPKSDVNKVLDEPPLTSATDKVLQNVFDSTPKAGVKISHVRRDLTKTAAAQALLSKIAQEAEEERKAEEKKNGNGKKEKRSQFGAASSPPPLSGASVGQIM